MSIRLAVVDDSAFVRKAFARICAQEEDITIVGLAATGEELLAHLDEWRPDAVTLDLSMPGIGGLSTLERILAWNTIPVLILSGHSRREAPLAVEALHRGAADFIDKQDFSLVDFQRLRDAIVERLRMLVTARARRDELPFAAPRPKPSPPESAAFDLVVVGASTGGPPAIEQVLAGFGAAPPVPIVIVQHMPAGFTTAFAERLNSQLPFPVEEVSHNRRLVPGAVYIAPGGSHLRVHDDGSGLRAALGRFPETPHRPSVDVLFRSAADFAPRVIGVLLTGMGDDGARGLLELSSRKSFTIAQDEPSSIVYGMPRAAAELGAVTEQISLPDIGPRLRSLLSTCDRMSTRRITQ